MSGEVDLLTATGSGIVHEFEIKLSRSDYLREYRTKANKHENMKTAHLKHFPRIGVPNYYWLATWEGVTDSVPSYCGHIEFKWRKSGLDSQWRLQRRVLQRAPRLHAFNHFKNNPNLYKRIAYYTSRRVVDLLERYGDQMVRELQDETKI